MRMPPRIPARRASKGVLVFGIRIVSNDGMERPDPPLPLHEGIYLGVHPDARAAIDRRPALFLDRDGVIVELIDYLHRPEDVRLIAGAGAAIAEFNRAGVPVIVVTNQAGIGRGYYDWADFVRTEREITRQLAVTGARGDAVIACPFHAEAVGSYVHPDHPCRKPNPGMFLLGRDRLTLDLGASWLVGDNLSDVDAAARAGLAGVVHVLTGHGARYLPDVRARLAAGQRVEIADSLSEVAPRLLGRLAPLEHSLGGGLEEAG